MSPAQLQSLILRARALGSRPGLGRIRALLDALSLPDSGLQVVHVTGTNGKGSCASAVYGGLLAAGRRAGAFMSPEVFSLHERISALGRQITTEELCLAADLVLPAWERLCATGDAPTEFELFVALALVHFRRLGLTHAVMEVGMGGKGDATNVFSDTRVCVFTPISLDHAGLLGGSIEAIAEEKCGILRPGCVAVTTEEQHPEALRVLRRACGELGCRLLLSRACEAGEPALGADSTAFTYRGVRVCMDLGGDFQLTNGLLALTALTALGEQPSEVAPGLARIRLPGRFSRVCSHPEVYTDAGHNPAAARALCDAIDRHLSDRPLFCVMAMYADKDWRTCASLIAGRAHTFWATQSRSARALPAAELAGAASACPRVRVEVSPSKAAAEAKAAALQTGGRVLICGSFGHISDALEGIL